MLVFNFFITFFLFFIYLYALGYIFTFFITPFTIETLILRLGVGLSAIPVIGVLFDFCGLPLDWRLFFLISLFILIYAKKREKYIDFFKQWREEKAIRYIFVIFLLCVIIYCGGAFRYPWLEDDDSWNHAASIKYVAIEKNIKINSGVFQYINPYPPGYAILLGILHQPLPSLYITLKFFNGFIVALSILFFYIFSKEITNSKEKALYATFFLASLPCYLSHFIWAHSLAVALFFPAFFCIFKSLTCKKYILPASIAFAGILLTQPTQSIKFIIMCLLFYFSIFIVMKQIKFYLFLILFAGIILSSFWYYSKWQEYNNSGNIILKDTQEEMLLDNNKKLTKKIATLFDPYAGSTSRAYNINTYLFPPLKNFYNNPEGIGIVLCILSGVGLILTIYKFRYQCVQKKIFSFTLILWLIFIFCGLNSVTFQFPIGLFAYRFWALFAIPIAIFATEAVIEIKK